jgi:hypothetical protein
MPFYAESPQSRQSALPSVLISGNSTGAMCAAHCPHLFFKRTPEHYPALGGTGRLPTDPGPFQPEGGIRGCATHIPWKWLEVVGRGGRNFVVVAVAVEQVAPPCFEKGSKLPTGSKNPKKAGWKSLLVESGGHNSTSTSRLRSRDFGPSRTILILPASNSRSMASASARLEALAFLASGVSANLAGA